MIMGIAPEPRVQDTGGGRFPIDPHAPGGVIRTSSSSSRDTTGSHAPAVFPAFDGSVEGNFSGAPLLVLCLLGFVTLAWAAASGKPYKRHADVACYGETGSTSSQRHARLGGTTSTSATSGDTAQIARQAPPAPPPMPPRSRPAENHTRTSESQVPTVCSEFRRAGDRPVLTPQPSVIIAADPRATASDAHGVSSKCRRPVGDVTAMAASRIGNGDDSAGVGSTEWSSTASGAVAGDSVGGASASDNACSSPLMTVSSSGAVRGSGEIHGEYDRVKAGGISEDPRAESPLSYGDGNHAMVDLRSSLRSRGVDHGSEDSTSINGYHGMKHGSRRDVQVPRRGGENDDHVDIFESTSVYGEPAEGWANAEPGRKGFGGDGEGRLWRHRQVPQSGEPEEKHPAAGGEISENGRRALSSPFPDAAAGGVATARGYCASPGNSEGRAIGTTSEATAAVAATANVVMEEEENDEQLFLAYVRGLLQDLERDLDIARVLLPECHRFRKVVGCVGEAVGPGMGSSSRQAMDLREALEEATEFTSTLSSPESFVLVLAELLSDGFEEPSAMMGSSTRRIQRAVSALPEPSGPTAAVAVAARAQLCTLATAGVNGAVSTTNIERSRSSSFSAPATAAAAAAPATSTTEDNAFAAPPTASSSATAVATPVSGIGSRGPDVGDCDKDNGRRGGTGGGSEMISNGRGSLHTPRHGVGQEQAREGGVTEFDTMSAGGNIHTDSNFEDVVNGDSNRTDGNENDDIDTNEVEEVVTTCGGSSGGDGGSPSGGSGTGDAPVRTMGPSLTSEAAGLSDLIRRRGGMAALTDGRTIAAVLRAAAPRRSQSFHQQQPRQHRVRAFFDVESEDVTTEAGKLTLSTPTPGEGGRGGEETVGAAGGGGDEPSESGVSGSLYVTATCGGFFGSTKSPQGLSPEQQETLPWPSPQDANGVCQKLAKRVEARVEAMVPFTCTNPAPACERRRLRLVNNFFFSVLARGYPYVPRHNRETIAVGAAAGSGSIGRSGALLGPRRKDHERLGAGRSTDTTHCTPSDFEGQLYAVLGALLEAANELVPGARDGGAAVNAVGETTVLTLKGCCALDRAPSMKDTSLTTIPRRTSMCQHALCTPRLGRKTLEGGARQEDGVLLVPDCRKLRQEIVRSTCMDPMGHIRPDYVSYVAAPIFADGAPLGNFCVFSRKTLKELGWTAHHTTVLRGLADAASTEMIRIRRLAELDSQRDRLRQQRQRTLPATTSNSEPPPQDQRYPQPSLAPHPPLWASAACYPSQATVSGAGSSRSGGVGGGTMRSAPASPRGAPPPSRSDGSADSLPRASSLPLSRGPGAMLGNGNSIMTMMPTVSPFSSKTGTHNTRAGDEAGRGGNGDGRGSSMGRATSDDSTTAKNSYGAELFEKRSSDGGGGRDVHSLNHLDNAAARTVDRRGSSHRGDSIDSLRVQSLLGRASGRDAAVAVQPVTTTIRGGAVGVAQEGGGSSKLWYRALQKLKMRKRKSSTLGGSDDGSGRSLDGSRRRSSAGSADSHQVFVERSRAW